MPARREYLLSELSNNNCPVFGRPFGTSAFEGTLLSGSKYGRESQSKQAHGVLGGCTSDLGR